MKKVLLPLVALMLTMVACQKENEGILTLTVEEYNTDAKLHLDADKFAVWDNNDAVWVNGTSYNVSVSSTNASGTATLTGVTEATTYTALYPASWANSTTLTYPEEQTYRESNGKQIIDAPMAAYSDGGTLKFHNVGSILAVNVTGMSYVKSIKVVAAGTTLINGTCTISNITTDAPTLGTPTSGTNTTILECNGVSVPSDGKTFYIALPPVSAKLTIIVEDGSTRYTKSQNSTMSFASNHGYNVPFSASTAAVEQYAPLPNQIWYTTNDNSAIDAFSNIGTLVSNEYNSTLGYFVATYSSNVTSLPMSCLKYQGALTDIILPEGLTTINYEALYGCGSLSNIVLPYSLTQIASFSFAYCHSLRTVEIPNPNVKIKSGAFFDLELDTLILHTNNPFNESDISTCIGNIRAANDVYNNAYSEYFNRFVAEGDTPQEANRKAHELATEVALGRLNLWIFGNEDTVNVYVPDVSECTNLSYDCGVLTLMGGQYYKPWQYMIDKGLIELHPLSSL